MKFQKKALVWFCVITIYMVGLAGFMISVLHDLFVWLIPFNILFAFGILILGEERFHPKIILLFVTCFLFGYFIELAGTNTGVIFGEYTYGKGLGIALFNVPLLIGVNWFFMVYTSAILSAKISSLKYMQVILTPAFMVLYDYFLEPFAMRNDMWAWTNDVVPFQNYVAWYVGGFFLACIAVFGQFNLKNKYAIGLYFTQLIFFVLLYFYHLA